MPDPPIVKQAFRETIKTVEEKVQCGPPGGLYDEGEKVDGRYDGYKKNKKLDSIFLERALDLLHNIF